MMVRHFGELEVFFATRRFATPNAAKFAWNNIQDQLGSRGLDLGLSRHGTTAHPGTLVTAISLFPGTVAQAEAMMLRGTIVDPLDDGDFSIAELDALITRRAIKVTSAPPGALSETLHHPGGAVLNPDGTMEER